MKKIGKDEQIVYIGDNFGTTLLKDTVFIGGIPDYIQEIIKEVPRMEDLFVPLNELVAAKVALETQGTIEHISNEAVKTINRENWRKKRKGGDN